MRPYETLVVFSTDTGEENAAVLAKLGSIIEGSGGSIDESHDWGVRRMAYPIKKLTEGHYHLLEYQADPSVVSELERNLRISESVLRYMSVQQEHTGLPEQRSEESASGRREVPMSELRSGGRERESPETKAAGTAPVSEASVSEDSVVASTSAAGVAEAAVVPQTPVVTESVVADAPAETLPSAESSGDAAKASPSETATGEGAAVDEGAGKNE